MTACFHEPSHQQRIRVAVASLGVGRELQRPRHRVLEGVDGAGVDERVIRIALVWRVVGILAGDEAAEPLLMCSRSTMRMAAARVAGHSPVGHRRRVVDAIDAVLDQQREERRGEALAHRPALELRVLRDAGHVALGDDVALVEDQNAGRQRVGVGEREVNRALQVCARSTPCAAAVADGASPIGHGCDGGVGQLRLDRRPA